MQSTNAGLLPDKKFFLEEASRRTGLTDYGDRWFMEPFTVLLDAMRKEASLNEYGVQSQSERILNSLTNRLIIRNFVNSNPQIKEISVSVAGVISGLPRSGSTMLQRLLAQARDATSAYWWETYAPVPYRNEEIGKPSKRFAAASKAVDEIRKAVPDIDAIHPLYADQPDEEVMLLEQSFIGWVPEAYMWIPSYAEWLKKADQTIAYQELYEILQLLTFQDKSRLKKRWVLKAPYHVTALPVLMKVFPGVNIIMTHRDPLKTVPSFCSFNASLAAAGTTNNDPKRIGQHWQAQLARGLQLFMAAREQCGEAQFVDIYYEDQIGDPVKTAAELLKRIGIRCEDEDIARINQWMARFPRDKRPTHQYSLDNFGLSEASIKNAFSAYREKFIRDG